MKPIDSVDEEDGPWDAPLAALNHLFPFHLGRTRLGWIPRAGTGEQFSAPAAWIWRSLVAAIDADERVLRRELGALDEAGAALLESRWWRGIGAVLVARAEALACLDAVAAPLRPRLAAHAIAARRRHEAIGPAVADLVGWLARVGVDCALTKGLAHASTWYPEPWSRSVGDVDVVVRPADQALARRELERRGAVPNVARGSRAFDEHHHGVPLKLEVGGHPLVCELHTRLGPEDPEGRLAALALAHRAELTTVVGRLPVLAAPARLAHAVLHHTAELDAKGLLDLFLAARRESAESWRQTRAWLPKAARWRLDLAAGIAAHLGDRPELLQVIPSGRRAALERRLTVDWGRAHAAFMARSGGHPRPRHWLASWRPRVDEVVERPFVGAFGTRQVLGFGHWIGRQCTLVGRLFGDTFGFVFPPPATVVGSYAANTARACKSLAARALSPLRSARPR